ncbi:MAG: type II secretion system F family protein [Bryobacterales bacterium]|nr:type II secretion system F family protein [Bryobacteraceae bacterium]MDW8131541.1 type II secretion system F family protein [Bryobacterales bacterium]
MSPVGFFLVSFLIFAGCLLAAGYLAWTLPGQRSGRMLAARLREVRLQAGGRSRAPADLIVRERGGGQALANWLGRVGGLSGLQELIDQANLRYRAAEVMVASLALAVVSFALLGAMGFRLALLRLLLAGAAGSLPILYVLRARRQRLRKFEEALPDAIDLFNRSMKAGHNIHAGLETLAAETLDPVRAEFRKVMEELALGAPLETALHNLGRRVPLMDLKFFITGLILQRQTGANLIGVLDNLSVLMRERLALAAKMKAHTAQQRFSAGLLCALPLIAALGIWFVKPDYLRLLFTHPVGSKFLTYAVISEVVGILIIRRIANVRY